MNKQINFGTDGIRGNSNLFPFSEKGLILLGQAISHWAIQKYQNVSVLLAYDTRESSPRIKETLCETLSSNNINVYDIGVLPTPAVLQIMLSDKRFNFGIMISASHNPYIDNGIKIFDGASGKLSKADELSIEQNCLKTFTYKKNNKKCHFWPEASNTYTNTILSHFPTNLLQNLKIVLDCANGATFKVAPQIFQSLGATVYTIFKNPNGKNINENCGALHTGNLINAIKTYNADIGFAFDGDGDRVIAVSKNGKVCDGDDLLAILLNHPEIKETSSIVGTIMTNHGFDQYLKTNNKVLLRTNVGDKYVSAKLSEKNLLIGGESSGHIIVKKYLSTGDGIFAALKTLESVIINNNFELDSFKKFPQILINVPVNKKSDLKSEPYASLIKQHISMIKNGRIVVRYSGTENVLRVMTEDQKSQNAQLVAQSLATNLQKALNE